MKQPINTPNGPLIISSMDELIEKRLSWRQIEDYKDSQPYNERISGFNATSSVDYGDIEDCSYERKVAVLGKKEDLKRDLINKLPYNEYLFFESTEALIEEMVFDAMDNFAGQLVTVRLSPRIWAVIDVDAIQVVFNKNGFGMVFGTTRSSKIVRVMRRNDIDIKGLEAANNLLKDGDPLKAKVSRFLERAKA